MTRKQIATRTAWSYLGQPYKWGGDDPLAGFDCSGFVIEILKSVGVLPSVGDWRAAALATRFPETRYPDEGTLVFWGEGNSGRIVHVEYCLDGGLSIGASGGGSGTITVGDATAQNAYIKVRPFRNRGGRAVVFRQPMY